MMKIFHCLKGVRLRFKVRPVNFFLLLSVLYLCLIAFPGGASAQVVDIPDPGLRAAIAQALGKAPTDAITRAEMETLVELRAVVRNITDLSGIEFAINLTELELWINNISDISPLSSLTNLTQLDLDFNNISDISPLSSLTNLKGLLISFNEISDIAALSSLTNLIELYITNNDISDIAALSSLTNLIALDLRNNDISDIAALSSLTNLIELDLGGNAISDVVPLIVLTNLEDLRLRDNNISDISALATLTNLTYLDLSNNTISNIVPLIPLTNLRVLSLQDNNISNILQLSNFTNLISLNLSDNNITDIVSLIPLTNLVRLSLSNNNIWDIETLEQIMARGTIVFFSGNPAFETPGPKIEEGWVGVFVPATGVFSGSQAAASGRDFLAEASGGTVTEADVAVNGAQAGTAVGDSIWTPATLDATDPNNLNTLFALSHNSGPNITPLVDPATLAAIEDPEKRNALMPADGNVETHIRYPVAYGVVPIHSETPQQTRVYIGAGPVKVWVNGALVYRDIAIWAGNDYATAVPITLNAGNNVLFVAAYRPFPFTLNWGAFFGFQNDTVYTVGPPGAGNLDVNGDGQVTVVDLAVVALFYGIRVPAGISLPADVNADGVVDILDLTAVAQGIDAAGANIGGLTLPAVEAAVDAAAEQAENIEGVAAAPMGFGTLRRDVLSGGMAAKNVANALADTRHLGDSVPAVLQTLLQLLTEMRAIPETTALLPNYPNPFNPETWLPYQLSTPSSVSLSIYSVDGQLVRTLDLGHQPAGVYQSKHQAAYWDGKNQLGEPVASGVYFYTLTAGEFTATRKMLIAK